MVTPARDSEPKCEACLSAWERGLIPSWPNPNETTLDNAHHALIAQLRAERDEAVSVATDLFHTCEGLNGDHEGVSATTYRREKKVWISRLLSRSAQFLARLRPAPNGGGP
jgi:hypothetical protein